MEPRFLFPHRFKLIGWILAIPSIILGLFVLFDDLHFDFLTFKIPFKYLFADEFLSSNDKGNTFSVFNFTDEIATIGTIVGLLFIAFSKLKLEDEYVSKIRLESLQWAIYFNFVALILATIFIHGMTYFNVVIYNIFTPLIFFIVRFYYILLVKPRFDEK
ncbi:hypothetical protein EMA8858_01575 [Emticicia aquatica]|uniref:Uncharacterized protein n=1 Tax=Emticicia aquatica TaxID=1681835 RepID=A0ABM9AQ94_9BACT|nr:hypothetical protein [Emticicia aquatica]CAH0995452.1 hypothetical protein EMA8858_01575 [Emticicia aquatica]